MLSVMLALLASLLTLAPAAAQDLGNAIRLDSLQLSALSMDVGRIRPAQSEPARVFGITADYGRLSRTLRLRFEGSYWESRLTDGVVRAFTDSLRRTLVDPSNDDARIPTQVTLYDALMGVGARWLPLQTSVVQPFVGGGVALHIINAEGPLIDGTFVEKVFDAIAAGPFAEVGVLLKPLPRAGVEVRLRGDLVNAFRSVSIRTGGVYYFGPLRRTSP